MPWRSCSRKRGAASGTRSCSRRRSASTSSCGRSIPEARCGSALCSPRDRFRRTTSMTPRQQPSGTRCCSSSIPAVPWPRRHAPGWPPQPDKAADAEWATGPPRLPHRHHQPQRPGLPTRLGGADASSPRANLAENPAASRCRPLSQLRPRLRPRSRPGSVPGIGSDRLCGSGRAVRRSSQGSAGHRHRNSALVDPELHARSHRSWR